MGGNKKPRRPWQCAHSKMQLVAQEKHVENILLEEEARSKVMPMVSPCYLPCHMLAPCSPPSSCSSGTIINTPENLYLDQNTKLPKSIFTRVQSPVFKYEMQYQQQQQQVQDSSKRHANAQARTTSWIWKHQQSSVPLLRWSAHTDFDGNSQQIGEGVFVE